MKLIKRLLSILIFTTLLACSSQKSHTLESLLKEKFTPPDGTHTIEIQVTGNFSCPFELWSLRNGSEHRKRVLEGTVDTTFYRGDWYGSELSFKSNTPTCIDKEAIVKVIFYHSH